MTKANNISFTSASTIPAKLVVNTELTNSIMNHKIYPAHVQINPSNKCPLNCSFCSCKNRDKKDEIDFDHLLTILKKFIKLGTRAVTVTGGGEPLTYSHINELIQFLAKNKINIGLVTNGVLFKKFEIEQLEKIMWCRISLSDEQLLENLHLGNVVSYPVDWSFSYVVTKKFNKKNLINVVKFANERNFTHVRIVDDILMPKVYSVKHAQLILKENNVNDDKVIYQGRKTYRHGNKKCFISLLKPNIDTRGMIFPCCGIQYAVKDPSLNFDDRFSMGSEKDIEEIYKNQKYFDGSICKKCYYSEYNDVLSMLWNYKFIKHKGFL